MGFSTRLFGGFLLLATLQSAGARAQEPTAALSWQVPDAAGCASRQEIQTRVARLTSRTLAMPGADPQLPTIVAELRPADDGGWAARVTVRQDAAGSLGARELSGKSPDCRGLDVALSLVIATLLDALPAHSSPAPAPAAVSGRPRESYGIAAGAVSGIGLAPGALFGLQLGLQLPLSFGSLVVDGSAYLPDDELDARGRGARLWLWHAGLSLCPTLWRSKIELQLCGGPQLGAIHALGVGLSPSTNKQRLLVLAGIEPKLGLELGGGLGLRVSALAGWALVRPKFAMDLGGSELYRVQGNSFVLLLRIGIIGFLG